MDDGEFLSPPPHPELDPDMLIPASEATKDALMGFICDKVADPGRTNICRIRYLQLPESPDDVIALFRMNPLNHRNNPDNLAQVAVIERQPGVTTSKLRTTYLFNSSPDGLQVSKKEQIEPMNSIVENVAAKLRKLGATGIQTGTTSVEQGNAELENELGLNFVSEHEAKQLLKTLSGAQPKE